MGAPSRFLATMSVTLPLLWLASSPTAYGDGRDNRSKGKVVDADLFGFNEVSGGDNGAFGTARLTYFKKDDALAYAFTVLNLDTGKSPTLTHIHKGAAGVDGPVVIAFNSNNWKPVENAPVPKFSLRGTFKNVDGKASQVRGKSLEEVLQDIFDYPENYYANFHSENFPQGAVRAQLYKP